MGAVRAAWFVALMAVALQAQTPVRDQPRVTTAGTASVSGMVVTNDTTRAPLRRATLTLTRMGNDDTRMVATDDDGRFTFDRLPSGSYTLSASKGAYISMNYGAPKPGMPGSAIALADGQAFTATPIALMRGAVIAGRLTDRAGRPIATTVHADQFLTVNGERRRRTSAGATGTSFSNAHGEFRIFGLLPGDYVVWAAPPPIGTQAEVTSAELVWVNRPDGTPPAPARSFTPAPTMFPGTTDAAAGVVITVGAGEERLGADFSVQYVPVSRVSGTVNGPDGRPASNAVVLCQIGNLNPFIPPSGQLISMTGADGAFTCPGGVAPGQYVFAARMTTPVSGGAAGSPSSTPLWGFAELGINGRDISNVVIQVQPSLSVSGQTVFRSAGTGASPDPAGVQLRLVRVNSNLPVGNAVASARSDGTFQFDGIYPGSYRLVGTPAILAFSNWMLRSAVLAGQDITDVPIEITQSTSGLVVTFSDVQTELSGTLTDAAGRAAPQLYVFVFPADKTLWSVGSRRVQSVRSNENGAYRIAGLPPGEYYLCALTELETTLQTEPSYLEQFVSSSHKITLGEGEKKRQDLAIR